MIDGEASARAWLADRPEYDAEAAARLDRFVARLTGENERQNLVAASSIAQVWRRHIVDSAQLMTWAQTTVNWLDLGSGAGFPGLVVATLRPDCRMTLVESRPLRARWLRDIAEELSLANVRVLETRLERVDSAGFDAICARAFAPLPRLLSLSARFSTADTVWLLPKGRSARDELDRLDGWEHTFHVEQSITSAEAGIITGRLIGRKAGYR